MTEQLVSAAPAAPAAPAVPGRGRRVLWAVARWTAAVVVCGGVGAGTALGITALDRGEVPGLETEADGRWPYPRLSLPALPADRPRPFTKGNDGEVHHADPRRLLLPAPAGATVDPKADGGWVSEKEYLSAYAPEQRRPVADALRDSALRHIAARAWTMPDGTTTRIHLLRFSSVAFSEQFRTETLRNGEPDEVQPAGAGEGRIHEGVAGGVRVPGVAVYAYEEKKPYGPEQTRWAYLQAGDTLALITQTRKGGALDVPFRQTVVLQAQLLG